MNLSPVLFYLDLIHPPPDFGLDPFSGVCFSSNKLRGPLTRAGREFEERLEACFCGIYCLLSQSVAGVSFQILTLFVPLIVRVWSVCTRASWRFCIRSMWWYQFVGRT